MTKKVNFLLIGGGVASAMAAEKLRNESPTGKINYSIGRKHSPLPSPTALQSIHSG